MINISQTEADSVSKDEKSVEEHHTLLKSEVTLKKTIHGESGR